MTSMDCFRINDTVPHPHPIKQLITASEKNLSWRRVSVRDKLFEYGKLLTNEKLSNASNLVGGGGVRPVEFKGRGVCKTVPTICPEAFIDLKGASISSMVVLPISVPTR